MSTSPKDAVVWAEIPVTDFGASIAFYEAVTGYALTVDESGPNPMAIFGIADMAAGTAGHLYPGTPAARGAGPTVHLAVEGTVEEAAARCSQAGGVVVGPVVEIPAGRFQYATDPDGNSIGLFQVAA